MENKNTERKTFSQLVKEAEDKNLKIVVVADSINESKRAKTFIESEHFMVISIEDLLDEDKEMIAKMWTEKIVEPLPIVLKALDRVEDYSTEGIIIREDGKLHHTLPTHHKPVKLKTSPNKITPKKNLGFRGRR